MNIAALLFPMVACTVLACLAHASYRNGRRARTVVCALLATAFAANALNVLLIGVPGREQLAALGALVLAGALVRSARPVRPGHGALARR